MCLAGVERRGVDVRSMCLWASVSTQKIIKEDKNEKWCVREEGTGQEGKGDGRESKWVEEG